MAAVDGSAGPSDYTTVTYTVSANTNGTLEVDVPTAPLAGPYWHPDRQHWSETPIEPLPVYQPPTAKPLSDNEFERFAAAWRKLFDPQEKSAEKRHARPSAVEKEAWPDFPVERQRWLAGKCVLCGRKPRRWFKFLGAYCRLCHPAPDFVIGVA